VLEIYGCDDNPLAYMIEPRISVVLTGKDPETDPRDFETLPD